MSGVVKLIEGLCWLEVQSHVNNLDFAEVLRILTSYIDKHVYFKFSLFVKDVFQRDYDLRRVDYRDPKVRRASYSLIGKVRNLVKSYERYGFLEKFNKSAWKKTRLWDTLDTISKISLLLYGFSDS